MFYKCLCSWSGHISDTTMIDAKPHCPICTKTVFHYNDFVTRDYLRSHPNQIFIFGDNLLRVGKGGAAFLRDEPNTYGFITKKAPNNYPESFYTPSEYTPVYHEELKKLEIFCDKNNDKTMLLSKVGFGLANKYMIWEIVIFPDINYFVKAHPTILKLWQ